MSTDSLHKQKGDAVVHHKHPGIRGQAHPPGAHPSKESGGTTRGHRPRAGTWHGKDGQSTGTPAGSRQRGLDDEYNPNMPLGFENTYKMEPDYRFNVRVATEIIEEILEENLHDKKYDAVLMSRKTKTLTDLIKERIKELKMTRHKLVTWVLITEKSCQAMQVSSQCIWDHRFDNYASATYANKYLHAVGMVFAVYSE